MTNKEKDVAQQCVEVVDAVATATKGVVVQTEATVVRAGKAVSAESPSLREALEQVKIARTAARKAARLTRKAVTTKVTAVWRALSHRKPVTKSHA